MLTRRRAAAGLLAGTVGATLIVVTAPTSVLADTGVTCTEKRCKVVVEKPAKPAKKPPSDGTGSGKTVGAKDETPEVPPYYRATAPDGTELCVSTNEPDPAYQATPIDDYGDDPPAACRDSATDTPRLTPAALAQMAVAKLVLPEPDIGSVPEVGRDRVGLVGMPVWLWTDPADWRPIRATAAVPGMSITATARISRVVWDMGDGSTVICRKPGTVYRDRFADRMSPDCGYRYQQPSGDQPNDAYTVTATATYQITWTGAANGSMTRTRSSSVPLTIGEVQVLVTSN